MNKIKQRADSQLENYTSADSHREFEKSAMQDQKGAMQEQKGAMQEKIKALQWNKSALRRLLISLLQTMDEHNN